MDFPGSDLACGEVAGFSGNISESQERSLAEGMRGGYTCCVPECYNNNKKDKEVSFHKFFKDKLVREKWINAIKRKDFIPTNHYRVCSNHFMGGGGGGGGGGKKEFVGYSYNISIASSTLRLGRSQSCVCTLHLIKRLKKPSLKHPSH